MKIPVFAFGLVIATGVALAQSAPAPAQPANATPPASAAKPATTTPAKPGAKPDAKSKDDPKKKKEEPMGVIDGIPLNRPNGEFLGLKLVDGKFQLKFYNKKKKPTNVDVTRATARWPNIHGPGDNRTVLNVSGANTLTGAQFVRGPYSFMLYITLLRGEGDQAQAVESYTVQFHD